MSLDEDQVANRNTALSRLKFNKLTGTTNTAAPQKAPALSSTSFSSQKPPAQSRDATITSHYFPRAAPLGSVLAPNSSPLGNDLAHIYPGSISDTLASPRPVRPAPSSSRNDPFYDPLSAPTLFTRGPNLQQSSAAHAVPAWSNPHTGAYSIPNGAWTANDSPNNALEESPDPKRVGKRRRLISGDSNFDVLDNEESDSKPARIHRANGGLTNHRPVDADTRLTRLKMLNPLEKPERVLAAYNKCSGDVAQAVQLLFKKDFHPASEPMVPSKPQAPPSSRTSSDDGHEREEEEMKRRAARAATKEKSKLSKIYAKHDILDGVGASAKDPITIPASPTSPDVPVRPPILKKAKRQVVGSESEPDWSDEDGDIPTGLTQSKSDEFYGSQALQWFNNENLETLMELSGCTRAQAEAIKELQPFTSVDDLKVKLAQGKRKAGPAGLSPNLFEECVGILEGYTYVDDLLDRCESIGLDLQRVIDGWTDPDTDRNTANANANANAMENNEGVIAFTDSTRMSSKGLLLPQPRTLAEGVTLKEYQLIGVSWLNLLYIKGRSCILADEMGLGKTIQVISLFAHLQEKGNRGPHLVVVPSSTLENWIREFERFAPNIAVQSYYEGKEKRSKLRHKLKDSTATWEVLITTYALAQGDEQDRKFFQKMNWQTCVFDEGHVLKNFQSQRYSSLTRIRSRWRLLLTGTPLQNNLQELVSLMNFILPDLFSEAIDDLRAIFKVKADSAASLLSRERVSRAKKMMTPFVLRRRKDQVLKELPRKFERIEWCEMTNMQSVIYREALQRSRKLVADSKEPCLKEVAVKPAKATKVNLAKDSSSNVLMDLRKAASHPMLFRRRFTDTILVEIAKVLLQQSEFIKRGALLEYVREDMEVMTDSELQMLCNQYKGTRKFALDQKCYLDAGKISTLMSLLDAYRLQGRRVLIFSQFTQVLDILQAIFQHQSIKYLLLTGSTAVDLRQSLVDEFNEDETISAFLLSTKAGGMGINLTAASVVVLFDQDFNPHNDRQAADRAYRIGQTRDVDVVKLITRGTIEEDMLRLGQTKLALDEAVAGEDGDAKAETVMKASLMASLRQQLTETS